MKWVEAAAALVLAALAVYVVVEAAGYPDSLVPGAPGPAFFPRLLAVALLGLCALLLVRLWRSKRAPSASEPRSKAASHRGRVLVGLVGLVLTLRLVPYLGALVVLPPALALILWLMGERRPPRLIAIPLAFDLFLWLVFVRALAVDLPNVWP